MAQQQVDTKPVSNGNPMDRKVLEVRVNAGIQLGAKTVNSVHDRETKHLGACRAQMRRDPAGILMRFEDSKGAVREILVPYAQITFIELAV